MVWAFPTMTGGAPHVFAGSVIATITVGLIYSGCQAVTGSADGNTSRSTGDGPRLPEGEAEKRVAQAEKKAIPLARGIPVTARDHAPMMVRWMAIRQLALKSMLSVSKEPVGLEVPATDPHSAFGLRFVVAMRLGKRS
jgi:hypothetical protein